MTDARLLREWNMWYDGMPPEWRFNVVLWPVLILATLNMWLTIATRFPFGLLLLLGLLFLAWVRVPYVLNMIVRDGPRAGEWQVNLGRIDWIWATNRWYDDQPEPLRFVIVPALLVLAGTLNMALTLGVRFPFGVLFLAALLFIVFVRGSFTAGWITGPDGQGVRALATPPDPLRLGHDGAAGLSGAEGSPTQAAQASGTGRARARPPVA